MNITKRYGETDFITGMRAYAAFGVAFIHAGSGGIESLGEIGNRLAMLGSQGVAVFFVISGYSVAASFASSNGFGDYINKRFWRIAPLYYFWISISLVSVLLNQNSKIDVYSLIMHMVFLSALDYHIAPFDLIGVDWTLSIEMVWYFFVPLIFIWAKDATRLSLLFIVSGSIFVLATKFRGLLPLPAHEAASIMHFSPIPYVFNFCLGVIAFKLRDSSFDFARLGAHALICTIFAFIAFLMIPKTLMLQSMFLFFSIIAFVLIVFGSSRSKSFNLIFGNRLVLFGGTISYGIYLCHLFALEIIDNIGLSIFSIPIFRLTGMLIIAIILSTATYLLIEKPSLSFGRVLFSRLNFKNKKPVLMKI
ncbi:MAG TPA: acyltransferase [Methylophilaceae bacterium]|nr:acyltransferase [Methylophilaceae bacterium]